jgi:hypothetical protein
MIESFLVENFVLIMGALITFFVGSMYIAMLKTSKED